MSNFAITRSLQNQQPTADVSGAANMHPPTMQVTAPKKTELKLGTDKEHLDVKAKRMQAFLKKIAKSRSSLAIPLHSPFKADQEKNDKTSFPLDEPMPEVQVTVERTTERTELDLLKQYEKEVKTALTYYAVIAAKPGFISKLPGTASAVLESICNAVKIIQNCLRKIEEMKEFAMDSDEAVNTAKTDLYHSITDLIRLSDDVLFDPSQNAVIDKKAANDAAERVKKALSDLYDYVIPRITKYSVNCELLQCSSSNSSSTSLDTMDNIPETEFLDNVSQNDSLNSSHTSQTRDSGFVNEMSDCPSDSLSLSDPCPRRQTGSEELPPPKPPLPSANRTFYGNLAPGIRHAVSQPDDFMVHKRRDHEYPMKYQRPISELSGSSGCLNSSMGSASNRSSKSSLSSCGSVNQNKSNVTLDVPTDNQYAPISIKRRIDSQSDKQMLNSTIDHEEIGISNENYSNIQKHTDKYELLARSSLCLCSGKDDEEDLLSEDTSPPPLLPKKKPKQTLNDNYLNIIDGYDAAGFHEGRPSSFYDNFPVPNVHNITEDQIMNGDSLDLPKLPPKRGAYRNASVDEPPGSPNRTMKSQTLNRTQKKPRSRRESSDAYKEDNVAALDSKNVNRFLSFKDTDGEWLLCGGTIDALIVHATDVKYQSHYYKAFVATYRTFVSPPELICKLLYRANRFHDKSSTTSISRNNCLRLLVNVINEMFEELDKSLFAQLRSQVHRLLNQGELSIAKDLRDGIVDYCLKIEVNPMPTYVPEKSESDLFEFKSTDIAQQMCVLDTDYFVKIELPEVLRWAKEQSESLCPNLSRFISHFNDMSFWVRTLVIREHRQQEREKLYKKFLKIMRILRKLNNFSSFLAIMSALDSTPVRRLEWPKHFTDELSENTKLIESESSFKTYRETLAEAKPPCIPYLGLILTDITFIHLGNPQHLPDGKVNFLKRWNQYNLLDSVRKFKESLYHFPRNEKILDFFNEYEDHLDEDALWEESLVLRPRGK
jgi:hypothetical protein